ncbi:probable rRNA maturation factor [Paramaledivibacter caminithermalis DSM 15212]|uniref:Endoribonuclease YbeY n=1 Tax=Paramaledivibacter caminithermalis (strain DSM 15212 / CIP 107654 / DViRD3) TaxID=1121301 RepID=A0A1M6M7L9_PARC5|nr:rRNA maturation RNase YbeY [Paramaledivibacter caminithermalis]SHJ79370.1 probable rRNA maturation factor [Paramaledivibacter caminithermalis DSM 15212]
MTNIDIVNNQDIIKYESSLVDLVKKVVVKSLETENVDKNIEVSISFVDNSEIRYLNKNFRNKDKETDVLSFPQYDAIEKIKEEKNLVILGDIVISLEKAKEQAIEYGHSFEREVAFLTAHSMFHLFGYDHDTDENTMLMRKKEEEVLDLLGILR